MVRANCAWLLLALLCMFLVLVPSVSMSMETESELDMEMDMDAQSEAEMDAEAEWPTTLLEHAASHSAKFEPELRTLSERVALTQTPNPLKASLQDSFNQNQNAFNDAAGHSADTRGSQREQSGRAREPQFNNFNNGHGAGVIGLPQRAPRRFCGDHPCAQQTQPSVPTPTITPIPNPPTPTPTPIPIPVPVPPPMPQPNVTFLEPEHNDFPTPPSDELPLPVPPKPSCGDMCNPKAKDVVLTQVPSPPLNDEALAAVGLEGKVLKKVMEKIRNREQWLRQQKLWLSKAVEAAETVRREIELAEFTKNAVASDLEQLKMAQDALSIKYKADRLKWSFKDKKMTLSALRERVEALEHAKQDVQHQIREAKDEVTILENTLGPPSEQVQITPRELEEPLKFLEDVQPPEEKI